MGMWDSLVKVLGKSAEGLGDDAAKLLSKVDTAEKAVALTGKAREDYLNLLDTLYGDQLKRAIDMGYDPDIWYHGSSFPIEKFDKGFLGETSGASSAREAFFFAKDPSTAADYADYARHMGITKENVEGITARREFQKYSDSLLKKYGSKGIDKKLTPEEKALSDSLFKKVLETNAPKKSNFTFPVDVEEKLSNLRNPTTKTKDEIERLTKEYHDTYRDMFTSNPEIAEKYHNSIISQAPDEEKSVLETLRKIGLDRHNSSGQNVLDVRLKGKRYIENYGGEGYGDNSYTSTIRKAKEEGKDLAILEETMDPVNKKNVVVQDIAAVFEPENIRSTRAAFDPRFKNSNLLMAGGLAGAPPIDMSPLDDFKSIFNNYNKAKDALIEKTAEQMDFTKDSSAKNTIQNVLGLVGMVADPMNLIPGAPGLAAGALQMGLESLPEKKQSRLNDLLRRKKENGLP
jgi:hypothetical protein